MATQREPHRNRPADVDPAAPTTADTDAPHVTGGAPEQPATHPPGEGDAAPKPRRKPRPRFVLQGRMGGSGDARLVLR